MAIETVSLPNSPYVRQLRRKRAIQRSLKERLQERRGESAYALAHTNRWLAAPLVKQRALNAQFRHSLFLLAMAALANVLHAYA